MTLPISGTARRHRGATLARRRQQAARSARERILASADLLFYANGIQAIGVQRLIEESAVTRLTSDSCSSSWTPTAWMPWW